MEDKLRALGFSDINVSVENVTYPLQRIILCKFPFFCPLLKGNFMIEDSLLHLDFLRQDWEYILSLVYSSFYPEMFPIENRDSSQLISVILLADYLQDEKLVDSLFAKVDLKAASFESLYDLRNTPENHALHICK